jgi:hypothetical protein
MGRPILRVTTLSEAGIMQGFSASHPQSVVDERPDHEISD